MSHDRFYLSPEWKRARAKQLRRVPVCEVCLRIGVRTIAAEVDHVTARRMGGAGFDPNNLQSLCRLHHSQKTAHGPEAGPIASAHAFTLAGADGYPVSALPEQREPTEPDEV